MEKVIKKALGYFKPKENEDFTHVIFTEKEYDNKEQKIRDLENNITKLEREYNAAIERYKKSADSKIAEIRTQANERIAEAQTETTKQKNRADSFEIANRNLIRVATERANTKRGLAPKKQHIGYVFLNIEEYTYNCECYLSQNSNKTKILKLPCFRVKLQSPYEISFDLEAIKNLIENDFKNKKIYIMLGIAANFNIENWIEPELIKLWNADKDNFIFKISYKANFQKGFWEVEYSTRYMPLVPPEMTIKK